MLLPDNEMNCMYMGAGNRPVAGRHVTPVKLHHVPVMLTVLGQLHGLGAKVVNAGNAAVMLHTTFRAIAL